MVSRRPALDFADDGVQHHVPSSRYLAIHFCFRISSRPTAWENETVSLAMSLHVSSGCPRIIRTVSTSPASACARASRSNRTTLSRTSSSALGLVTSEIGPAMLIPRGGPEKPRQKQPGQTYANQRDDEAAHSLRSCAFSRSRTHSRATFSRGSRGDRKVSSTPVL